MVVLGEGGIFTPPKKKSEKGKKVEVFGFVFFLSLFKNR